MASMPPRPFQLAGLAACGVLTCFILYTTLVGSFSTWVQYGTVLALALGAVFLLKPGPLGNVAPRLDNALSLLLIAGSAAAAIYMFVNHYEISAYRQGIPTQTDLIIYAIGTLVVLEGARRAEGPVIPVIVLLVIGYLFAGPYLPGFLGHRGHGLEAALELAYSERGIFGIALGSVVEIVYIYVIFGVALRLTGAADCFSWAAGALTMGRRSGAAQCAIIASALFGSVNGSAPANVMANGHVTINLMHRAGYSRAYGGAVEATSSVVGQIMPPVMGVGAFIMAEITGIPYVEVMLAALAPAFFFLLSLSVFTSLEAAKLGLAPLDMPQGGMDRRIASQLATVVAGFCVLFYMLFAGYSVDLAGLVALGVVIATSVVLPGRPSPRQLFQILIDGGREGLSVALSVAAIGIIIGAVSATGLGIKLSQIIVALGGTNLFIALLLAAFCTMLLGLSLPTAPSYLMVVFIIGPALAKLGLPTLSIHLFVFYYAVMSAITPPVSLAAFAASAIAQVPAYQIQIISMRLAFVGFVFPFIWIYQPELLLYDLSWSDLPDVLFAMSTIGLAVFAVAAVQVGFFRGRLGFWERILLGFAAVLIFWPDFYASLVGSAVGLSMLVRRIWASRSSAAIDQSLPSTRSPK